MSDRILLIDDEPNVLQSIRRGLHGRHKIFVAEGGQAGIEMLRDSGPFAVVVSDMQMPDVDGMEVLRQARQISPDTVRIMLTGNADQGTAVNAVNEGAIYRFINKPCPSDELAVILDDALRQFQVVAAEKNLLSKTLTGSMALVSEVLAVANPRAFGRGSRMRHLARRLVDELKLQDAWQYEVAAMLSQFGCIGISQDILERHAIGQTLTLKEEQQINGHAEVGSRMVGKIPRLELVAQMIECQDDPAKAEDYDPMVQQGAQLLHLLAKYDLYAERFGTNDAIHMLQAEGVSLVSNAMLKALVHSVLGDIVIREVRVRELVEHMVLEEDVLTRNGDVLIKKGHELTENLIHRLMAFEQNSSGVREPFRVRCHATDPSESLMPEQGGALANQLKPAAAGRAVTTA